MLDEDLIYDPQYQLKLEYDKYAQEEYDKLYQELYQEHLEYE